MIMSEHTSMALIGFLMGAMPVHIEDERFKHSIDQFGEGLADFMRHAMVKYADSAQQS